MTIYAFPSGHNPQRGRQEDGMTLRDYFAAKAMEKMNWVNAEESAKECYRYADAMLKARDE